MTKEANAEIISIGTEILLGELTDTNSVYMARILRDIGVNVHFMTSVGDNVQRIADAIHIAFSRAQIVITCGGLGPTIDDMTRQAVATATERELEFHQTLYDQIAARFADFRVKMTENNRRQAYLPVGATQIENPVGTAPAFLVEHDDHVVISLPGVPREMKYLFKEHVVPYLREHYAPGIIKARTLKTAGIGESALDELIGATLLEQSNPTIGLAAHSGQIDVRITAKATTEHEADRLISVLEAKLQERIGDYLFGADNDRLEHVLAVLLQDTAQRITIVEAGLDARIANLFYDIDAGDVLADVRSFNSPAELATWMSLRGNPTGLRELAQHAAQMACIQADAGAGIAVVAQPEVEEAADADSGSALAVYTPQTSRSRVYGFGGRSDVAHDWARSWTLSTVWQMLKAQAHG